MEVVLNKKKSISRKEPSIFTTRFSLSFILKYLVYISASITFLSLVFIIGYIFIKGIPNISIDLFSTVYTSENVSLFPALVNTLIVIFLSLVPALIIGIGSAIYITEYSIKDNKLLEIIRIASETLSGIPSIVYGLFGMLFFLNFLGWGFSLLSGSCTLSIMILPLIMKTTEEALKSIPDSYREGSLSLGAGKFRTIMKVVLPSAMNGILSGVILSIGRIVGETAALIYTAGTVANIPNSLFSSGRTLAVHMYMLSSEGLYMNECYATAVILIILVIFINSFSKLIANNIMKGK